MYPQFSRKVTYILVLMMLVSSLALSGSAWAEQIQPGPPDPVKALLPAEAGSNDPGAISSRVLARGATLHGANGANFGPDGLLYIASFIGGGIEVLNPDSGRVVRHISLEQGMDGPDDLTFGPDGSLYWTSIGTGKVGVMAPDGTQSLLAQLPPGANPITFSEDGRLFVALDFLGEGLYEIYLDGSPPRLVLDDLGWLNAFDFGPDGYLYGPIYNQGQLVKIDVDTGELWVLAEGFAIPAAVKFDANGKLNLLVQGTGEVLRMNPDGTDQQVIARLTPGLDNLAIDDRGRIFVTHAEDGTVYRILPNGKGLMITRGGMIAPGGVAALPGLLGADRVFVADFWTLREFNGQTGRQGPVERHVLGAPLTVAPDGNNLLLSSWMDNAVYTYDPQSMAVLDTRYDFAGPMNAVRFQGDLIVSELGTGRVVRSSAPGDYQVLAELGLPIGLAATDDDLYVADWAIGGVFQVIADGVPVFIPLATGLAAPEGLAVLPDGDLLVVEGGAGRVSRIDLESGEVSPLVEGLQLGLAPISGIPPFFIFNGIAVGPSGAIYVSGDKANVLYRIDIRP